jgi:hypothetical protein
MCKEVKPFLQAFELAPAGSVYRSALVSFYARQGVTRSKSRTEKSNSSGAKPKTWDHKAPHLGSRGLLSPGVPGNWSKKKENRFIPYLYFEWNSFG